MSPSDVDTTAHSLYRLTERHRRDALRNERIEDEPGIAPVGDRDLEPFFANLLAGDDPSFAGIVILELPVFSPDRSSRGRMSSRRCRSCAAQSENHPRLFFGEIKLISRPTGRTPLLIDQGIIITEEVLLAALRLNDVRLDLEPFTLRFGDECVLHAGTQAQRAS